MYLKATKGYGIHYTKGHLDFRAFCDVNWACDPNDRRSTTGMVVFLVLIPFLGPLKNNKLLLDSLLKQSTELCLPLMLNLIGLNSC